MLLAVVWKCQNHFQSLPSDLGSLLSFLFSAVWDLLWLACWVCGQNVQHTGLSQYEGTVPPQITTSRYFTPACWLGCALQLFWGQLCFYNTPKRSRRLSKNFTSTWPSDCDIIILITVNVINCYYTNIINILFFKHPLWKFLSRLLKTLCIPLGEIRTQRSCDCNKQGRCFKQAVSPIKTMACILVHHNSLIQPAVTHASVHNTDK